MRANERIQEISDEKIGDSANFAAAEIIFVITTKNRDSGEVKKTLCKRYNVFSSCYC